MCKSLCVNFYAKGCFTTQSRVLALALENIVGKEENAGNQHFLLFPQCFLLFPAQISVFESLLFCCLQMLSIWSKPKFCCLVKSWPLPHNTTFLSTIDVKLWKTLLEKKKLLVTSNFSYPHNVFYPVWHLFFILNPV